MANYFVIRNLSRELIQTEFEKDIEQWKKLNLEKIHRAAYDLYRKKKKALKKKGKNVTRFIT